MPFDPEFDAIFENAITPALASEGCKAIRADSDLDQRNIMQKVVHGIVGADIIIAEITSLNANVMYELGLSHGLDKPTVILTQDVSRAPFDLRSYVMVPYSVNFMEMPKLLEKLSAIVREYRSGSIRFSNPIKDFAPDVATSIPSPATGTTATWSDEPEPESDNQEDEESDDPPGLLDLQVDIEESLAAITADRERLGKLSTDFGAKLSLEAETLQALAADRSSGSAARKRTALLRSALVITSYAKEIESIVPGFRGHWTALDERSQQLFSSMQLKTEDDRKAALRLIGQMEVFSGQMKGAVEALEFGKAQLKELRGVTRDLDRAVTRTEKALSDVAQSLAIGESFATRVGNVLQDRLANPPI